MNNETSDGGATVPCISLLAELCGILSAALARGIDAEHPDCRVLLELPMTEGDYMRLRTIVEANSVLCNKDD